MLFQANLAFGLFQACLGIKSFFAFGLVQIGPFITLSQVEHLTHLELIGFFATIYDLICFF